MTEAELKRKLAAIEALLQRATTEGERAAAENVFAKLKQKAPAEQPEDVQFTVPDPWGRKLFIAMVRKAGLEPFRLRGQRRTTVMVHGRRSFVVDTVWREFTAAHATLSEYLEEVTDRVIRETLGETEADAKERPALPRG
ncbi:MAG: hypothetical protein IPJ65_28660 [Archangiaceae bacterium]|nr:hypothetical protein [Archangiaceae bacterium]